MYFKKCGSIGDLDSGEEKRGFEICVLFLLNFVTSIILAFDKMSFTKHLHLHILDFKIMRCFLSKNMNWQFLILLNHFAQVNGSNS